MSDAPHHLYVSLYEDAATAASVTAALVEAGFAPDQLSVICSDPEKLESFPRSIWHPTVAEAEGEAATTGAEVAVGASAALAAGAALTVAGLPVAVLGAIGAAAVTGPFTALMLSRGVDDAAADFYDAEVADGKVLVSVETTAEREQHVRDVFNAAGGRLFDLPTE